MQFITANAKFSSTDPERTQTLIHNWNSVVGMTDVVFHLGVFALENSTYYLAQLNGMVVAVVGEEQIEFDGPKFKNLFTYADGTISQHLQIDRGDPIILTGSAKLLTDSEYPEFLADDYGDWKVKSYGERIVGSDYSRLLVKPVINAVIDLWEYKPISMQMITERYLCS